MGKFSIQERERIQEMLVKEGSRLFGLHGLRKTSVEDIAGACAIGKGTFYLFYSSKEELLLEILDREEISMHQKIYETAGEVITAASLTDMLTHIFLAFYDDSVAKTLYALGEFPLLFRKIPQERAALNDKRDYELSCFLLERLPGNNLEPDVFMGLLRSVFLATLHKEIIGTAVFEDVIRLQLRFIAEGLAGNEKQIRLS
ncbi:MAG: TetR/AcrR family transcriptional regulator [Spirochaetales bacterium]|nr:TetR/AcrR family transcriptional regulator [Spirochaetales bacterium]